MTLLLKDYYLIPNNNAKNLFNDFIFHQISQKHFDDENMSVNLLLNGSIFKFVLV